MTPFRLDGRNALVTGGGTGLGFGIARCLAQAGARVAIVGRRPEILEEALPEIGESASAYPCDVTDLPALPGLVARVEEDGGPLSILVNGAGNHLRRPAGELGDAELQSVLDVHLAAAFAVTREVGRRMVERGDGSIVFLGSLNATIGMPQTAAYGAAKAALAGLVTSLAAEWAPAGVRVNTIVPGWIDAGMARRAFAADEARKQRALARTPMRRLGAPDDIGWAAVYLSSPASTFVTGTTVTVDGGATIGF
jgi:gluconate 5-dehydrogenase